MNTAAILVLSTGLRITDASSVTVYTVAPHTPVVAAQCDGSSWVCLERTGGPSTFLDGTNPPLSPEHVAWVPWAGSPASAYLFTTTGLTLNEWFYLSYGMAEDEYLAWHRSSWWGGVVVIADPIVALEVVAERLDTDDCDAWPATGLPLSTVVQRPWKCPPLRVRWAGVGDINMDGLVNAGDFAAFVSAPYDYDQSGTVDVLDFKGVQDAVLGSTVVGIDQSPTWQRYAELTTKTESETR